MSYIRAEKVLFICAIFTVLGALFVTLNLGTLSKGALFACYIFEGTEKDVWDIIERYK